MKESGYSHWKRPNVGATNETGFSSLPGGFRGPSGYFDYMGNDAFFWSASEYDRDDAWTWSLYHHNSNINRCYSDKKWGFSVRLVLD